jgi:hypothetical protein
MIAFPKDAFDIVTTHTKQIEYMLGNQEELTDLPVFPPVEFQEPNVEELTTQKLMFLLLVWAPLLLRARGYTVKEVWDMLYPAILQRQELDICAPLLRWLQASSTGTTLPDPLAVGDPITAIRIIAPPADELLLSHYHGILHCTLPGLLAPPQSLETALSQMATALMAQTNDTKQAQEQKFADEQAPKLPSECFTVTLPVLMEYLQQRDERHLPDIWHHWANCSKRQELQVLRDTLDAFARSPDAYSSTVPIVTARLMQDLLAFNFIGQLADDLKGGLHPFIVSDGNSEHRQTNLDVSHLYSLLAAEDTACTLADLEALSAKEVRSVPVTYWELESNLGMFGNLFALVMGVSHPLVRAYKQMWTLMQLHLKSDLCTTLEYRAYVKPTHVLRSIQLILYSWFSHTPAHLKCDYP